MPGIQQIYRIIKHLPINQPILLQGKHGVGKSDILRKMFEADGYRIQPLFLGQAADAGDLIGLPNRVSLRNQDGSIMLDPLGQERIVSDFAPPIWWPFAEDEKVVIFFDEVNRGKPEMMQCIMDLTLNRKLNGRLLPPQTRIIAAMNPLEDGYYQVEDLDPAFLDRWNVYDFTPTKDEWLQWANESGIHKHVIGFINTYKDYLDTPTSSKTKASEVQPSRRSWERVSDVINMTPDLIKDLFLLNDIMAGIVGTSATSAFTKYLKEVAFALSGEDILTKWDDKVRKTIEKMPTTDTMSFNYQIEIYFKEHLDQLRGKDNAEKLAKHIANLKKYLDTVKKEVMADFFTRLADSSKRHEAWPRLVVNADPDLTDKMLKVMRGEDSK